VTACGSAIPDLLRRFVPVPYQCHVQLGGVDVDLRTNDPSLVSELSKFVDHVLVACLTCSLFMTIVRDDDAPCDRAEIVTLRSGPLMTVRMGTGTILCLDCERRELLGFIAPDVSAPEVVNVLLPLAMGVSRSRTPDQRHVGHGDSL
jgi:hypothetical protein